MGPVELPTGISLPHPHWEALTPETQQAFRKIAGLEFVSRFYLAGGTGLALHLGHRFSVDLDFFSTHADAVGADRRAVLRETLEDPTRAMAYFEDAEALPMPRMVDRTPWPVMKRFLERQALEAGRKRLEDLWE